MAKLKLGDIKNLPLAYQEQIAQKTGTSLQRLTKPKNKRAVSQEKLWAAVQERWPMAVDEYKPLENRRFKIDIAFVELKIAIEIEGWENHGKYKKAHQLDCKRTNLIALDGWTFLRFYHGEIMNTLEDVLAIIEKMVASKQERYD